MDSKVKNSLILLPVIFGVAYAGYLLFKANTSPSSLSPEKKQEVVGQVLAVESEVKRQFSDDVVWNEIPKDANVYNQDSIRTGQDGSAIVKLDDQSVLEIGPNSLIVLNKGAGALDVNFKAGDIAAKNSSKNLQITVKGSDIRANGADLKIKTDVDSGTRIQVAKGKASIIDKSKKQTELDEDEAAELNDGEIKNVKKVAVVLNTPDDKTMIQTNQTETREPFTWKTLDPRLKNERFQISTDVKFPPQKTTTLNAHQAVATPLRYGVYYWRVAWLAGQSYLSTESRQITVGTDNRLELIYPENSTDFDLDPDENQVDLKWTSRIDPKLYVAEIAATKDFKTLIVTHTVKDTKDTVQNLPSQTYYWRVRAFGDKNEELAVSPVRSFTISVKLPTLPELLQLADDAVLDEGATAQLLWKKMDKAVEYRVVLSKDEDQKIVLKSKSIAEPVFNWKAPKRGSYFWAVRAMNSKGVLIGESDVRRFEIQWHDKGPLFDLVNPKDKIDVVRDLNSQTPEPVTLQWKLLRTPPGPVSLLISRDADFKQSVHQDNLSKTDLAVRLRTAGLYYWKLTSAAAGGTNAEASSVGTFNLKSTINLLSPEIIQPNDKDQIEIENPQPVKFIWKPVTNAAQYHLIAQRTDPLTKQPVVVLDRMTKDTTVSSTPLPEGNYTWTLTSVDNSGQEGLSDRAYQFSLTPPQVMDAPKLNAPVIK